MALNVTAGTARLRQYRRQCGKYMLVESSSRRDPKRSPTFAIPIAFEKKRLAEKERLAA
jgi:hypothetical protein